MKISTVLDHVEFKLIALPEFQRGYVWGRDQVRGLFHSLYRRYPVGGLLLWTTEVAPGITRGSDGPPPGTVIKLLLDGQQRVTSLYGVIKGRPPDFFQGNAKAFTDLYFHLGTETFEFYGPVKMKGDPLWVSVTELFRDGQQPILERLQQAGVDPSASFTYLQRIIKLLDIGNAELHPEEISGNDLEIEEVVDIFNRVNSGGTKLSAGDLALARICADRPGARAELRRLLDEWAAAGFHFTLEWLLRCVTSVVTGQAKFTALRTVSSDDFEVGLKKTEQAVNFLLNLVGDRLGLDHDRVLAGRYSFTALVRLVADRGGSISDNTEQQKVLYWYIHNFLWGRYSGSTETVLQRDLDAIKVNGIDGAIAELTRDRGSLKIRPEDFDGRSVGARFYPMVYLLTRVGGARDLDSGMELKASLLGSKSALQLHHIFPKRRLYDAGYERGDVNAIANMCFLTASTNLSISDKLPREYLAELEAKRPGVLGSQWISTDPALWEIDAYPRFLADRRHSLADAANAFLDSLYGGTREFEGEIGSEPPAAVGDASLGVDVTEQSVIDEIVALAHERGLAVPLIAHEITDSDSGEVLAVADLAWPDGAQEGLTPPVAMLLGPDEEMERRLGELGYTFFTSKERLVRYLERLIGADIDGDDIIGEPEQVS